ncbi:hypothetical protein [Cytobacillus massiliigabonensis]|uniref:hypothetical protein n=1 Tax=Cytobacillus massiliigabonensis TaxID=1871011 RepID=UPI001F2989D7|nr:hypothetical protein [Cytobacillus massiliigabonensis]
MKKGITALGCFFIAIAAFLYAAKHITAAIISAYINTPDVNYYEGAYELIGFGMTFWTLLSLLAGILFLLIGIWPSIKGVLQVKNPNSSMNKNI